MYIYVYIKLTNINTGTDTKDKTKLVSLTLQIKVDLDSNYILNITDKDQNISQDYTEFTAAYGRHCMIYHL